MSATTPPGKGRFVKGSVLIDYVKLFNASPHLPWSDHLTPEDLAQLRQLILPVSWYPLELFQRLGQAVFKLVSKENDAVVHGFGRFLADKMNQENPGMVTQGRPQDTLRKYAMIQDRLYSFKVLQIEALGPGQVLVRIMPSLDTAGARLFAAVTAGTIERLIELSAGRQVQIKPILNKSPQGEEQNSLEAAWQE